MKTKYFALKLEIGYENYCEHGKLIHIEKYNFYEHCYCIF